MALHKKGKRPPNPDPGNCLWITTKDGGFWRRKRGTVKKAKLNRAFKEGSRFMQLSAPATRRIMQKLRPYMDGLYAGRLNAKISGRLRTELKETGKLSLRCLKGFDLQQDQKFEQLLQAGLQIQQTEHELTISIPIAAHTVKRINTLVTNYYFELVLLYGDVSKENGLRTESIESDVYEIEKNYNLFCKLSLVLPEKEWIALLKVNSIEGNEAAMSHKLYGMKVVAADEK
jgi:hypothetical protein